MVVPKSKCRPIITSIDNCTIYQITGKLLKILPLVNESKDLKNYEEYVIENNSNMRLIQLKTGKKYTIGQSYKISYSKTFGSNFYLITVIV